MMIIHIFIIIYLLFGLYVRLKAAKYCHNSQVATLWRSVQFSTKYCALKPESGFLIVIVIVIIKLLTFGGGGSMRQLLE